MQQLPASADAFVWLWLYQLKMDGKLPAAADSRKIHAALTERGQECELLVYGDEGHGLAKRATRSEATPRALAFLARHLASWHAHR